MTPEITLAILFLFVSMLYSSVGLGGGSSYTALMAIFGINYDMIPTVSLTLNMVVTFIAMVNFWRGGHLDFKLLFPFIVTSVPMAYAGGALNLSRELFLWLLLGTLVFVVMRIYLFSDTRLQITLTDRQGFVFSLALGAVLGFVAGTVGIGGGIYLVPVLILLGIASEKRAAAVGACFVWLNSVSGLISRAQRGAFSGDVVLPMLGAVVVGGFIGSHLGARRFSARTVQRTLGIVILVAILYLLRELA